MIEKSYNPIGIEQKWYDFWLEKNYFRADSKSEKPPFCIVIPPPNVTGSLHIGHALDVTLQDIIVRWKRMSGFNTLWLPGTDHAGIATQNVVEKELQIQGQDRHTLGREGFIQKVWEWKEQYGGKIILQLKRLGASCDWSRERFTLDEGLSRAVREIFVRLYNEDLIYKGDYIINWCTRCHTALSDLEVEYEDKKGNLYYIKYNYTNKKGSLIVATTRPETLLGDTAVAVHPDDKRYKTIINETLSLPVLGRKIPVIADTFVDASFGTGAVKVTPAHDPNDFDIAIRHRLPFVRIMTGDGRMSEEAGPYKGQDRFECRRNILKDLESSGLLVDVKEHPMAIGHCYRCRTVIEPFLSKQWFVKVKTLAVEAIRAVRHGKIKIIPSSWENNYFDWMENIKDWCISRQIWWGHRIPVWYCSEMLNETCKQQNGIIASSDIPEVCPYCGSSELKQDEDVLDTWFSSALWPFSTLGWPDDTDDLKTFYPTNVLITGFDILFFWVARMIMMGMKCMNKQPFHHTYIHALIRDAEGQKMSKSKGNVVDPLEMIETYGTDAFRFTLTAFAAQGRDIKFSVQRVEGYRHFINKIWNAARFILISTDESKEVMPLRELEPLSLADRWILSRLAVVSSEVNKLLKEYRFNDAASILYQFVWHEFCDWYLEMIKPALYGTDKNLRESALSSVVHVFKTTLALLHPFIPFITEELWQYFQTGDKCESLCIHKYPSEADGILNKDAEHDMGFIMDVVTGIRNIRGELNLPPSLEISAVIKTSDGTAEILNKNISYITRLAKAGTISIGSDMEKPEDAAVSIRSAMQIFVPLKGLLDVNAEITRLEKEIKKIEESLSLIQRKLTNGDFLQKAPQAVVEENRAKYQESLDRIQGIQSSIEKMKKWGSKPR
jgi:valyl-tRNA synthetase